MFTSEAFYAPILIPCRLLLLTDEGQYARAVELLRAMHEARFRDNRPFPMGWADNWPLLIRLNDQLKAALGAEAYQAAWERGAHIELSEMTDEMQGLLYP
jgi:hypothetical protein